MSIAGNALAAPRIASTFNGPPFADELGAETVYTKIVRQNENFQGKKYRPS